MSLNRSAANALFAGMLLCSTLCLSTPSPAQVPDSVAPQSTNQPSAPPAGVSTGATSPPAAASAPPARRSQSIFRRHTLDDRVKDLAKALDLNETQQAGVKAVLERQQLQARQIQFDQTLTGSERISHFRALQEDTVLRIRAVLNDEQKKKYDPLNHGTYGTTSDSYVDQWMMHHQQPTEQHAPQSRK